MRLGGPVFEKTEDPEALARAHVALGYRAAYCPGHLSAGDADGIRAVRDAYAKHDLVIAEVGAWRNLIPADADKRAAAFDFVCERLALADAVGARCCVDFAGTVNSDMAWSPEAENLSQDVFDRIVEIVRRIIDTVKPSRTKFTLEMMQCCPPDSVDSYCALLEAVDRPAFGVHLDPVNIILTPRQFFDNGAIIRDCFERLGPYVASCHAKDLVVQPTLALHLDEVIPGTGGLDYRAYLSGLRGLSPDIPLLVEHLRTPEQYLQACTFIRSVEAELEGAAS